MKKILICAIALFCLTTSTTAQTAKEVQKQRKEIYKMSKEELKAHPIIQGENSLIL